MYSPDDLITPEREKCHRCSEPQKLKLFEMVKQGNLDSYKGADYKQQRNRWWAEASVILNALPGANKKAKQWQKTYKDLVLNEKKRKDGPQTTKKIKAPTGPNPRPIKRDSFQEEMLHLMGGDMADDNTLQECRSFLHSKISALERMADAQESMAQSQKRNADNFEALVHVVCKYLENK